MARHDIFINTHAFRAAVCGIDGYCVFPAFLWEAPARDNGRRWTGRIVQAGSTWSERTDVTVRETDFILTTTSRNKSCADHVTKRERCRVIKVHAVMCLSEEPNGKFRVHMRGEG